MFKVMMLIARRDGLSMAEFIHHYDTVHAEFSKDLIPEMIGHRRNFVSSTAAVEAIAERPTDFDVVVEMFFASRAGWTATCDRIAADAGLAKIISEDEAYLFRPGSKRIFYVEDHAWFRDVEVASVARSA